MRIVGRGRVIYPLLSIMCVFDPHRIQTHVKSPVASLCLVCSSVRNRVRVMMSVLTASPCLSPLLLDAMSFVFAVCALLASILSQMLIFGVVF
jgi:hypothetical protein